MIRVKKNNNMDEHGNQNHRWHYQNDINNIFNTFNYEMFVTGAENGSVKVWSTERLEECIQTLDGHRDWVYAMCELRDGGFVSGSYDRTIKIWKRREPSLEGSTYSSSSAPNGVFQLEIKIDATKYGEQILFLTELQSSGLIASAGFDKVRLWNRQGELVSLLDGHTGWVYGLAEVEENVLISAAYDRTLRVWNSKTGRLLLTFNTKTENHRLLVLKDGSLLYGSGNDLSLFISDCWLSKHKIRLIERCCMVLCATYPDLDELKERIPQELYELVTKYKSGEKHNLYYLQASDE
eukprot:TRINITY_DN10551_c0_g1_i1.p1 TRINITY_DN10551_c0_g1~~TRINITY_DN10551_c0_g1_i1.p1  ORF type:complete len:294 (+),score=53.66 TRINITY_DN10551_c0_g1_i1:270-1151(+)